MMTPVEILRAARKRLTMPGVWVNYCPQTSDCDCAVTACSRVDRAGIAWDDAATFLDRAAEAFGFYYEDDVVRPAARFNDAPKRTLEEVLTLFDQAILLAESAP